jgi:hypothetical protein
VRSNDVDLIPALPYGPAVNDDRIRGRTHGSTRSRKAPVPRIYLRSRGRSLIASSSSIGYFLDMLPPRVTVLSAVGMGRRNIWSEAQALQCPQRACVACTQPKPRTRSRLHPRPGGNRSGRSGRTAELHKMYAHAAMLDCVDQRNGSPERQMLWRITDNLRANATRALPGPDLLAIAVPHSFKGEARFTRVRITPAAS